MSKLGYLLLIWASCGVVLAERNEKESFVQPLDFSPIFASGASLASKPVSAAIINLDKSQYPKHFDTIVSSSIDSIQTRVAPKDRTFSPESFGFNPIASSGFYHSGKSAKLVTRPKPQPQQPYLARLQEQHSPLQYDIRTVHDANYKVYKPEENEQQPILSALKNNPAVAAYFQPAKTNIEIAHPIKYRTEDLTDESEEIEQNYKPNAYITGPPRIRRYSEGKKRQNVRKHDDDEEEDPYHYRPKAFDGGAYNAAYKEEKEEKDPNKDYDYPYGDYDSGYDHKEYERIKELSEKQAAEVKQNPGNCKEVLKDGMTCVTCKDPKTGGNFESCSYVAEPKNNKYAYSKEKKFDSKDQPDEPESEEKTESPKKLEKYQQDKAEPSSKEYDTSSSAEVSKPQQYRNYKQAKDDEDDQSGEKYKGYYVHSSKPKASEAIRAASSGEDDASDEKSDDSKPYNYKQELPGFYTDNAPKKDVEHVLAEFKKKDRSACKKVHRNGMTCFQCLDKTGLKHEECMFVSESAPKKSHLAYKELKEFTSKPPTLDQGGSEEAESQTVVTSAPAPLRKSAVYVAANNNFGKKIKRKKASRPANTPVTSASSPLEDIATPKPYRSRKVKRSEQSEVEARAKIVDETNVAAPEEFSGDSSKGAFWAETMPQYSAALGVTLPQYMLSRSEHEASFDEAVAGA